MGSFKAIWLILTCSCDTASRLLSDQCESQLTRGQQIALRIHLWGCGACRRFRRQISFLHRAARHHVQSCPYHDHEIGEMRKRIAVGLRRSL